MRRKLALRETGGRPVPAAGRVSSEKTGLPSVAAGQEGVVMSAVASNGFQQVGIGRVCGLGAAGIVD